MTSAAKLERMHRFPRSRHMFAVVTALVALLVFFADATPARSSTGRCAFAGVGVPVHVLP